MSSRDALELVGRDGSLWRLEATTAALAEAVLAFCADAARTRAEIAAHVERETGTSLAGSTVVDELVSLLRDAGALARPSAPREPKAHARVVVGLGGAIASAEAPRLVQALQARGHEVRVIASERALRFVSRETLEVLTHAPVLSTTFPDAGSTSMRVPHVELAEWADLVVVWPATATTIGRIATGDCSELVSAVAITTRAPVLVAPSMNEAMLDAASVARNLETLRDDGFHVLSTQHAHEVAAAPGERAPMRGGAPDADAIAHVVDALARAWAASTVPHDPASWEVFHRRVPEAEHGWVSSEPDPVLLRLLDAHAPRGATVWDVGTGHGAIAIAAAARGHRVIATDVSDTALARARARAGRAEVVWLRDDVTASALAMEVDVVVDRGTLHTLRPDRRGTYAAQITARTRPGAIVIVTVHTPPTDARVRTHPMTRDEVTTLFGEHFELVVAEEGRFAGVLSPAPACVTCVLRRR